jgi:UDP-N-acetylglucosamine:LPS N-acetylglucosamine transferase
MVEETELGSGRLWGELVGLAGDPARRDALAGRARARGRPDAAALIAEQLARLVDARTA